MYLLTWIFVTLFASLISGASVYFLARTEIKKHYSEKEARTLALIEAAKHEIRTPLASLVGLSYYMKKKSAKLNEASRQPFLELVDASETLSQTLNEFTDIFHIENDAYCFSQEDFNLSQLVDKVVLEREATKLVTDNHVTITTHISDDIWINGDLKQIKRCIISLIDQAILQSQHGEVTVTLKKSARNSDTDVHTLLIIRDSSRGIDQYYADHYLIPEDYEKVSYLRGHPGRMLALNLAAQAAKKMGNQVLIRSGIGKGVAFVLTFSDPVVKPHIKKTKELPAHNDNTDIKEAYQDLLKGARLLLVDDSETNLMVLASLLEGYGAASITKVKDGGAAVDMSGTDQFDLIFMDIQMPVFDGIEATRQIKKKIAYRNVPVIGVSDGQENELVSQTEEVGMWATLEKPLREEELTQVVLDVSDRVRALATRQAMAS